QHSPPDFIDTPFLYFRRYFDLQIIKHITYQTNLYVTQKDMNTTFTTTEDEMMHFVAVMTYMGIAEPSIDDYWALVTRVPQVASLMPSKRFRLLRRFVHFSDNTETSGTTDQFFKIRPLLSFLNTAFRSEPQTPKQSVDEVTVAYKGKTAGNLRQYIKNKPVKWGFKLFSRASEDGFIHDMLLYQGKTTLEAHGVPLTAEQEAMGATSQIVSVLASTMSSYITTAIFADNFFTSLELVRYLKDKNCRYTGTEIETKNVPRGTCSYVTSDDGILALRWKDNKIVTLLSTDMGVEPTSSVFRYCNNTKRKEEVSCPAVIKGYSANMGGIDKSNMLALSDDSLSLKNFRIEVTSHPRRNDCMRFDLMLFHAPVYPARQTCKYCSRKGHILRSNMACRVCKVHLCLNAERNCFIKYHEVVT
uniref:PiggyBac transposable element-derived protein domain-containing protein n=1 Tax=Mastacembelus armatus TaxID=205130 RepID=A0A3Q3SSJ6_9TELE